MVGWLIKTVGAGRGRKGAGNPHSARLKERSMIIMAEGKGLSSEIRNIVSKEICDLREAMDRGNFGTAACIGYLALGLIEGLLEKEGATNEIDDKRNQQGSPGAISPGK